MYTVHTNPPSPSWKESLGAPSISGSPQSHDGHVTSTSRLPITPVRIERYLKPKQATQAVVVLAPASPRRERKIAMSAVKASAGQLVGNASIADESSSLWLSKLEGHTSTSKPQKEPSALPQLVGLSSQSRGDSLAGVSGTQLHAHSKKVARVLSFNDSSLRNVDGTLLTLAQDASLGLYSVDSLDQSDTTSMLSSEMNRSGVLSPRFYDGLPITLEELLSSSSESSSLASPQQPGKDGAATTPTQANPSITASSPLLSFGQSSSHSQQRQNKLEAHPHPLPPLAAIPLTPPGTVIRPRSSPGLTCHSDRDTKTLRAVNFRKLCLLKKVISLWRAGVMMKKDQADLLRRKMLLRRGVKALWYNYRVAIETNKMAVWHLQQEKTRRYWYKWKLATKARQLAALRHFFLLWKRKHELQALERRLTEGRNLALLSAHFVQWRDTFRFSLMEISASQFWRARIVRECFMEWRIRRAQRLYHAYAEEVVVVMRQSTLKKQAFQEWRSVCDAQRREKATAQMELLREAFSHWRSLAFDMRETTPGMVQSAADLRKCTLLKKGFRKWLLKYRGRCFVKRRRMGLLSRVLRVWCQQAGQRGRDMLLASSFSQQTLVRCCWDEMKHRCAIKHQREKSATLLCQQVLVQRCFLGWRRYMYRATLRCVCVQYVEEKRNRQLQTCFDHWVLSFRQKQNEGALSVCASWASKRSSLRRAFTAWVAVGRCARAQRAVQEHTRRFLIQRCFVHWRAAFRCHRTLRQMSLSKARKRRESAFCLWRKRVCHSQAERTALEHHRVSTLKRSFVIWKGEYLKIHHSNTCGALYLKSLTSRCLLLWRKRTAVRVRLGATLEQLLKKSEVRRKREVLVLWRRRTGRNKAVRLLSTLLTENLLKKCVQAWHHHVACSIAELEVSFLTHLHQAILSESHCSISTPTAIPSVTHNGYSALSSTPPRITSTTGHTSPAPTVEGVKRNLFQGTSLPSLPFKLVSAPLEETTTEGLPSTPHRHLDAATGVDAREVGVSHEPMAVFTLPSPNTKLRILEESPSPPTTEGNLSGIPLLLTPGQASTFTAGGEFEMVDAASLDEDVSFLSVALCQCVSDELRAQLQEIDSAMPVDSTFLDVSDDDSLEGRQPRWTEQEWDPAPLAGQNTEANTLALPTSADVSLAPETTSSLAPSTFHGTVEELAADLPKDSAIVNHLIHILRCWRMYPCGKVFHQWRCYTAWRKRLREAYSITSQRQSASILRECLGEWKECVQMCATLANHCDTLSMCFAQRRLSVVFSHWRRRTQCSLERSTVMVKAAEALYAGTLKRQSLLYWREEVSRCRHDRVSLQKMMLWRTKAAFAVWRRCTAARSMMTERTMQAADALSRSTVLACSFAQWKERLLALKRSSEAATGLFQDQRNLTLLSQSFRLWRQRYSLYHKQESSADILRVRCLLRCSISTWRRCHVTRMSLEKEMIVAAKHSTLKNAMKTWKRCFHAKTRASALADQHHSTSVLRASFLHWRERACSSVNHERMKLKTAEDIYQRSAKARCLRQWRKYLIVKEAERQEQCRLLVKRRKASRLKQSFRMWKHQYLLVQRMHQLRAAQCRRVLFHCWGKWKGLTQAVNTANKQHSAALLLGSWKKWRISFVEQRTADKVVAAANRRRTQQIFKAWMAVTFPARYPAPNLHQEDNILSPHSSPLLLTASTQPPSRELMGHIFNLWKYRARLNTKPQALCN